MQVTVLPTPSLMGKPPLSTSAPATAAILPPVEGQETATGLSSWPVATLLPEGTPLPWRQPAETAAHSAPVVVSPEPQRPPEHKPEKPVAHPGASALPTTPQLTTAHTLFNLALEAQAAGDLEQAMTLLQQAVKLAPTLKRAYNSLGNLYYQRQQYDDAVAMYRQALALDPDYTQARNNLGSAYMQLSQHERAIEELQKVLQADGEASLAYYNLACVYARTGDSAQAVHYLQRAMEIEPQARLWAQTDADFSRVRNELAFQRLVGSS
jgi:Tfp pilus assembly protein PilF